MTFELNAGRTPTNLSVDRINPNEGYTENNTQLVCMAINQMKSDFTNDEIYKFCKNFVLTYEEKNKSEENFAKEFGGQLDEQDLMELY
jgi:hypothetical protein